MTSKTLKREWGGEMFSKGVKRPGKGRNVQRLNVLGAKCPGGETSWVLNVLSTKRPEGETSRWRNVLGVKCLEYETSWGRNVQARGETSWGRNVMVAKRPDSVFALHA